MKDLLVGQILWSTWHSLIPVALLLTVWFKWHDQIGQKGFYIIFAFVVTASVQWVGGWDAGPASRKPAVILVKFDDLNIGSTWYS